MVGGDDPFYVKFRFNWSPLERLESKDRYLCIYNGIVHVYTEEYKEK